MSHDKLRQLILIEEFKRCIHSDVLWKNPVCITLHLVEFHLLQYNDGFKTREVDRTIEDIQDRTSLIKIGPSSHQHVTIAEKMVTWFLAAYESGGWCKNKIGFIIKPLSLSAVSEDTPPEFQERRLRQVLWVKPVACPNLSWIFFYPSFTMVQRHCQETCLTPYQSRFWETLESCSLKCWVTLCFFLRNRPLVKVF